MYDGKPFCAYHYHEANDSLCAAVTCGTPIEGPCAVSHSGTRFHPEHLTCEFYEDVEPESGSDYSDSDNDVSSLELDGPAVWAEPEDGMRAVPPVDTDPPAQLGRTKLVDSLTVSTI